ncbi:MAG: sugar-binding domain-containing protein, partial [Eubacteriales bacterium]
DYVIHQTPEESHNNGLGYFLYENAWYRKHFTLTEEDKNKRIAIRFGSVTTECEVFCNGARVGTNDTGNTSFEIDLTDFVWFERENVIAVHVITAPHESWWYEGGGICRDVWLMKTAPVFVAENGIWVTYEKEDEENWALHVETEVTNDTLNTVHVTVETEILDPSDKVVIRLS